MSDLYLDFTRTAEVMDFLLETRDFADDKSAKLADTVLKVYETGERIPRNELADASKQVAKSAFPARYALGRFYSEEGAAQEWQRILAAVRPSTAHILKRFSEDLGLHDLDEVLKHAESDTALHDEERREISEVRKHLRLDYWKTKPKTLAPLLKEGSVVLDGYLQRLDQLRDLAADLPNMIEEILSKIAHYEDRILFEGEHVPLEILDEEIKYYIEQKELSPTE